MKYLIFYFGMMIIAFIIAIIVVKYKLKHLSSKDRERYKEGNWVNEGFYTTPESDVLLSSILWPIYLVGFITYITTGLIYYLFKGLNLLVKYLLYGRQYKSERK